MPKRKNISFVVGVDLNGPVIIDHDVTDDKEQKQSSIQSNRSHLNQTPKKITSSSKKTCGQSQKSVRTKHKKS